VSTAQAACRRWSSSSSLSYSVGHISFSFSAESLALVRSLEWCHSYLKTCHFQSAFFLTDSQSALAFPSTAPAFIQPKSFWDVSDSLSSRLPLSFQWVPITLDLPAMNWPTHSPKSEQHSPLPMFSAHWAQSLQRLGTTATLFGDEIFLPTLSPARFLRFPPRNWPFLVSSTVNCPDFAVEVTAFSCPFT